MYVYEGSVGTEPVAGLVTGKPPVSAPKGLELQTQLFVWVQ